SDKANVELPSPHTGTVVRHLVAVGDMVAVDAPIAVMRLVADTAAAADADTENDGDALSLFKADGETRKVHNPFADVHADTAKPAPGHAAASAGQQAGSNRYGRVLAVPSARILARDLDIDIATVAGSGPNGRVRRDDVRAAAEQAGSAQRGDNAATHADALPAAVAYH